MTHRIIAALVGVVVLGACGQKPQTGTPGADAGSQSVPDAGTSHEGHDAGHPDAGHADADAGVAGLTWYRDVLPLVQDNCQSCHTQDGIAPFELETYADAFSRHAALADAVATRQMPPWHADDSCIPLEDSRHLPDAEIDIFVRWSQQGAPEGDPKDAPPAPTARPGLEWVDATIDPGQDYQPNSGVSDDYRCFILPPAFSATTDVIGFDVAPGTKTQVHHVILFSVPLADAQAKDDGENGLGWTCYGGPGIADQTKVRMVGGWVPGTGATRYPAGTGIRISAGDVLVMQVHYNLTNGAPMADRTQVKLQYAKAPVPKPATIFPISNNNFSIPPNSTDHTDTGTVTLPALLAQATIYGVTPHMHELGKRITVRNTTTNQCLIDIPRWDFHWQQPYRYVTPVVVKGGETIEISCTWDNPTARTVTFGEGTADEMCVNFFYATMP